MTTQIEAMKMALEALGSCEDMLPEYHQWLSDAQYELRAAIEAAEKVGPVEKMFQVIGMSVLKEQKYQDGYFIAGGDEAHICEMFYKQLRYYFYLPSAEIEEP